MFCSGFSISTFLKIQFQFGFAKKITHIFFMKLAGRKQGAPEMRALYLCLDWFRNNWELFLRNLAYKKYNSIFTLVCNTYVKVWSICKKHMKNINSRMYFFQDMYFRCIIQFDWTFWAFLIKNTHYNCKIFSEHHLLLRIFFY